MIYLGIDIGGTSVKIGLIDEKGLIFHKWVYVAKPNIDQVGFLTEMCANINEYLDEHSINKNDIVGAGIGCPGAINSTTGYCDYSNNLKWDNLDVKGIVEKGLKLPVKIVNDANAAVLGEAKFGCASNYTNVVLLTLGTGVGSGLYLNGQLYEGNEGKGAELGHMRLEAFSGRACTCGSKGCFEAYASATALIKETKRAMSRNKKSKLWELTNSNINNVTAKTLFDAKDLKDKTACKVFDNYILYLGTGILSICNIFRPEAIILSGGISNQKEKLIEPLKEFLEKRFYGFKNTPKVDILIAKLKADTGIIGAAALFMK